MSAKTAGRNRPDLISGIQLNGIQAGNFQPDFFFNPVDIPADIVIGFFSLYLFIPAALPLLPGVIRIIAR